MSRSIEELQQLVSSGNAHAFYVDSRWEAKRQEILMRDNYKCQRCLGRFNQPYPVKNVRLTEARYVHHIVPLKEDFSRAYDDDNLVSLCFHCHELVEGRDKLTDFKQKRKKPINEEKW